MHLHPDFKASFVAQRGYKKWAFAIVADGIGFYLGIEEFKKRIVEEYVSVVASIAKRYKCDEDRAWKLATKKVNEFLKELEEEYNYSSEILFEDNNWWVDTLSIDSSIIKTSLSSPAISGFKITIEWNKSLDKVYRPYSKLLDNLSTIQFV